MQEFESIKGCRVLVTGPTGQVGRPVVAALAGDNEVFALARYSRREQQDEMRALGAVPVAADLASSDLQGLPSGLDYVFNYAVVKSGDFEYDLAANAEGAGRLISACRDVKAFVHFSSAAVYACDGPRPLREDNSLGDNHRHLFPTYSISKIAAETVVRFAAREFGVPTTIARLSVPYGNGGGWPYYHLQMIRAGVPVDLHPQGPNAYNLIHDDDHIAMLPALCGVAATAATTLNLGGSEETSIEQWCAWLAQLTGLEPVFNENPRALGNLAVDTGRMESLLGPTRRDWRSGIHDMVRSLAPELLLPEYR